MTGWLKYRDSRDVRLRTQAQSFFGTLGLVIGEDKIDEFCDNYSRWRKDERESKTLDYYVSGLHNYFPHVEHIDIPAGSKQPVYYLLYTIRNETRRKIMRSIIRTVMRGR